MKKRKIWILIIVFLTLILTSILALFIADRINIKEDKVYLYIYPNATYSQVVDSLKSKNVLTRGGLLFNTYSKLYGYKNIKTGRYEVSNGMSTFALIRKLKSGHQSPVRLVIGKSRLKEDFARKMTKHLLMKKESLLSLLNDSIALSKYEVKPETSLTLFIPNTYEVLWDISPDAFVKKMYDESGRFWSNRKEKLNSSGFNKIQVLTLASIVEEETNKNDEKPRVIGVYVNRLNKGMLLQADPTVKYAIGDFSIRRITGDMLRFDSPYNTYKYKGLPPAPICIPSIASIDATLNYERHNYIFFCAKEDFSGYHNFATTYAEHMANARLYHEALNKRGIK